MNFFRKQTGFSAGILFSIAVIFLAFSARCIFALDPARAVSQYAETLWGSERGFPGGTIYSISQSSDGFLWIATDKGLIRFDGINFSLLTNREIPSLPAGAILGLTADADGNLWVRPQVPAILRYRRDTFENTLTNLEKVEPRITAMSRGKNGEVMISTLENGILKFDGEKFAAIVPKNILPDVIIISMAETADGEVWFGTRDGGLFRAKENTISAYRENLPDLKINCLLTGDNGDLLIGTDKGLTRWNGTEFTTAGIPPELRKTQILTILADRDKNVWIGTDSRGLLRLSAADDSANQDGKSSKEDAVTALFEDRDGNLWVGSGEKLKRLRESAFFTYPNAEGNGSIFAGADNRIWISLAGGALGFIKDNRFEKLPGTGFENDVVYSISGDRENLWLGRQSGGLTHLRFDGGAFSEKNYTQADGLAQNSVFAVYESSSGAVWAGTLSGGVSRLEKSKFTNYTTADGLVSNTINAVTETADGTIWLATPNGISGFKDDAWQSLTTANGLPAQGVNCLLSDSESGLWLGTSKGLARLEKGEIRSFTALSFLLQENIFGIALDKDDSLWITTADNVLRVNREKLLTGQLNEDDLRVFGFVDGLLSTGGIKRQPSVVRDAQGRIWLSLKRGISVVAPQRLKENSAAAIVRIQTVTADGKVLSAESPVVVSSSVQKISFDFTGISLAVPERVKFRFILEGFDKDWSAPTTAREAVYTNLKPGRYNFRVIASNGDGVWNSALSSATIEIEPVFWQTWWFLLVCLFVFVFLIIAVYQLRLMRMAKNLNRRYEERLAERMNIAQELHDSLLQGLVSASMQLDIAVDNVPADAPVNAQLKRVLALMSEVITEGRNTVRGLRTIDNNFISLEQAFAQIPQNLNFPGEIDFEVVVEGASRLFSPPVRDELYLIGREAIINAFRHAKAERITVELLFGARQLKITIRDDGHGIEPQVIQTGRDGHFGLEGMKERAEKIGAKLKVYSKRDGGTEVEISISNRTAFEPVRRNSRFKRLLKPFRAGKGEVK
ncbi:MAG TPA: two-component regulator propeller domain-containing protein [Pyrinomonadaceae bacterium]